MVSRFPKPFIKPHHRIEKQQHNLLRKHLRKYDLILGEGTLHSTPIFKMVGGEKVSLGYIIWETPYKAWRMVMYGPCIHCWADLDNAAKEYTRMARLFQAAETAWSLYKTNRSSNNFERYRGLLWEFFTRVKVPKKPEEP